MSVYEHRAKDGTLSWGVQITGRWLGTFYSREAAELVNRAAYKPRPREISETAETNCWEWQMGRRPGGYGVKSVARRMVPAHRVYYEELVGPVPRGLQLDHLCRNPSCVNPGHLEPVTQTENIRRGRAAKLTAAQVREIRAAGLSARAVHERYGLDKAHAWRVVSGRSWRGV